MNSVTFPSYAKVNLYLDILALREDNYHLLEMVNAKFSLHDSITIHVIDESGLNLSISDSRLPVGPENTVYRAAERFLTATNFEQGLEIYIDKHIPFGAGLGGGSSNAGAVLTALNQLAGNPLTLEDLVGIGKKIGADVPFFLIDGCCFVGGIGEILEPVAIPQGKSEPPFLVLCSPDVHVSTKVAYGLWDQSTDRRHSSPQPMIQALKEGDFNALPSELFNSFEAVIYPAFPELDRIYSLYCSVSPTKPLLSGSGSNMFSLHDHKEVAVNVADELAKHGLSTGVHQLVI